MNADDRPEGRPPISSTGTVATAPDASLNGVDDATKRPRRSGRTITATAASDIRPESVRWLWRDWIPLGALTTLAGQQGLGKSTLAYTLTARLTTGQLAGDLWGEPSRVFIATLEDHAASVVVPRLIAAGADMTRVRVLGARDGDADSLLTLPDDLDRIESACRVYEPRLLIVDPVVASLSGSIKSHNDQQVRRALAPMAALAERRDLAVLGVMHLNKGQAADLLNRVSGSIAFTAAPRSVIAFARHPEQDDDGDQRVTVHAKSNLGRHATSVAWRMEARTIEHHGEPIETNRLTEIGECRVVSSDLVQTPDERDERGRARAWLAEFLADGEPIPSKTIKAAGAREGFSVRTLHRARCDLGISAVSGGFPKTTSWQLPVVPVLNGCLARHNRQPPDPADRSPRPSASGATGESWHDWSDSDATTPAATPTEGALYERAVQMLGHDR